MPRNVTITFADGSQHVYQNVPDEVNPQQMQQRAAKDFSNKEVTAMDGGRKPTAKPVAKPKAEPKSWMSALGDATVNTVAGLAQGVSSIPDVVTDATGDALGYAASSIGHGVGAMVNAAGGNGDAISRKADIYAKGLHHPVTIGGVIENYAPTPKDTAGKVARFASQVVGGSLVPVGPKMPTKPTLITNALTTAEKPAAQAIVDSGNQFGVRVMTSDVKPPKTFIGKGIQALGERVPMLGTGGPRAAQQMERQAAVGKLMEETGANVSAPAIDDVMTNFAKTRGAEIAKHAGIKSAVIEGTAGQVPVSATNAAIDAQIAKLSNVGTDAAKSIVGKLQDWKQAIQGKDLSTIDMIRAEMGKAFKDPSLASIKDAGEKSLQSIYGPMKSDMGTFIKNTAGPAEFDAWQKANVALSGMADELSVGSLRSVLRSGQGTPEDVAKLLFSNKPSIVRRLYNNLSEEGRGRAQAAIMQKALEKSGGFENISPDKFVTQMSALGKSVGVFFPPQDLAKINGLTRLIDATRRAGQAGVMTNSGQQAVPFLIGGAAVTMPWKVAGGALMARAYESAPVRNALLRVGKTAPGSPQEAIQMNRAAGAIAAFIERNGIALNDNVGVSAAAGDGHENK